MARSISGASRTLTGLDLHPERWRDGLDHSKLCSARRQRGIAKDTYPTYARDGLLEQLQPFSAYAVVE